jgi:hypothetical protein
VRHLPFLGRDLLILRVAEYLGNSTHMKIALGLVATMYTINTVASVLACAFAQFFKSHTSCLRNCSSFWGALRKKLGLLIPWIRIYAWELGVTVGLSIVYVALLYTRSQEELVRACINGSSDQDIINACNQHTKSWKIGTTVSVVLNLLWQACAHG